MREATGESLNRRLREERLRLGWSQQELADHLGTTANTISRWELGVITPGPYFRAKLRELFGKTEEQLGVLRKPYGNADLASFASSTSSFVEEKVTFIWCVPFRRNPFFTGREDILNCLYESLNGSRNVALTQAINGLGGVGKTQIALEYAYRFRENYRAVLWVRAETRELLLADISALAEPLRLPEHREHDQQRVLEAVKHWLGTHDGWLLILDNVEDVNMIVSVLPSAYSGHVLLTTRSQASGLLARPLEVMPMEPDEGSLLLLRRAKLISPETPLDAVSAHLRSEAWRISQEMRGLPLALDQAGAYLEETGCDLPGYLERYCSRAGELLKRRGQWVTDHPSSLYATLALSCQRVAQSTPAASRLLSLCAFLAPDAIAEEMLQLGACELDPVLQPVAADPLSLDAAIAALRAYSLVRRQPQERTITIHRLVQAVLKDQMPGDVQRWWADQVVRLVNRAFPDPDGDEVAAWPRCQRYLPQVHACLALIEQWHIFSAEAGRLLYEAGCYLRERADFMQSETLLQLSLTIREQALEPGHPHIAESLTDLALLFYYQGRYREAEPLYQRALEMRERAFGPEHTRVADTLNNLALLYLTLGKYAQAEPLYRRALSIYQKVLGEEHAFVAACLNNLAKLYHAQGNFEQAEAFYQRAQAIGEKTLGGANPRLASSFTRLAQLYLEHGYYTQAEPLLRRALEIQTQALGEEHPEFATSLHHLAWWFREQGQLAQAESFLERALAIWERVLPPDHPSVQMGRKSYAELRRCMSRADEPHARKAEACTTTASTSMACDEVVPIPIQAEEQTVHNFFRECCIFHAGARSLAGDLWQAYQDWTKGQQNHIPLSRRLFAQQLQMQGCHAERTKTARFWQGIALKSQRLDVVTLGDSRLHPDRLTSLEEVSRHL